MRESLWSLGMDKQSDSASFSTDPLTSEEEVHWEQESFLLHGFVSDIMSAEEGGTEENKEKCEDKKEKRCEKLDHCPLSNMAWWKWTDMPVISPFIPARML